MKRAYLSQRFSVAVDQPLPELDQEPVICILFRFIISWRWFRCTVGEHESPFRFFTYEERYLRAAEEVNYLRRDRHSHRDREHHEGENESARV